MYHNGTHQTVSKPGRSTQQATLKLNGESITFHQEAHKIVSKLDSSAKQAILNLDGEPITFRRGAPGTFIMEHSIGGVKSSEVVPSAELPNKIAELARALAPIDWSALLGPKAFCDFPSSQLAPKPARLTPEEVNAGKGVIQQERRYKGDSKHLTDNIMHSLMHRTSDCVE